MLKLKNIEEGYSIFFESKQDEERLKNYLGHGLFDQYMEVRKKLPNLSNQFKDFSKIDLNTGNKEADNANKKELLSSYGRLMKLLPLEDKERFRPVEIIDVINLSPENLEEFLNDYMEARKIVFDDQARFRDFGKLMKQDKETIQRWVDNFQSSISKKKEVKKNGADKIYEDNTWIVYKITTYPAAQYYGSNTKWCITGRYPGHADRGEGYFNDYINDRNLDGGYYFYINKNNPNEKYCLLQKRDGTVDSIWDAPDTDRGSSYDELLDSGVELPEVRGINLPRYTIDAFMKMIERNNINKMKEYIENGIDVNGKASNGLYPLIFATLINNSDAVKLLLENGADKDIKDDNQNGLLHYASGRNNIEVIKELVEGGIDPDTKNRNNETPLMYACASGYVDIVKYLLEKGADPNSRSSDGETPLICAGNNNIIKSILLEYGAES